MLVDSIDAGKPVLAFGVGGDPECRILCGYEEDGAGVLGYRYFAGDRQDAKMLDNGMFRLDDWEKDVWKLVICGKKNRPKPPSAPYLCMACTLRQRYWFHHALTGNLET